MGRQSCDNPPSTTNSDPAANDASSLARNNAALATSLEVVILTRRFAMERQIMLSASRMGRDIQWSL
jgi:hypothetical protein